MKLTITNSPFASFALTALACVVLVPTSVTAQNMPTPDPACPPDTIVSTAFNMPNSTTCVLCSFIMEKCSASCSGPSADELTCSTDPDGCGEIVCPDEPPAPTPPTPVPPAPTAPPPPAPTAAPPVPPPDVGTPESCGIQNVVGCVLCGTGTDGKADCANSMGGVDGPDCNAYAPPDAGSCTRYVKYTYDVDVSAPPYNAIYGGAFRYRADSYWDGQYGNPREFNPERVGDNITPWETMAPGFVQYRMMQWESEFVNFCLSGSSVNTTFQFTTTSEEAGQCAISDGYQLVTRDVPFPMSASGEEDGNMGDASFANPEMGFVVSAIAQEGMELPFDGPNEDAPPMEDDSTSAASSMMLRSSIGSVFVAGAATVVTRMML